MACYRNGGCSPYEVRPCNECPASKPEYLNRSNAVKSKRVDELRPTIKIKVFLNEDGVSCVVKDTDYNVEIEIIDEVAVQNAMKDCGESDCDDDAVDAYINQLCGDGFVYVENENIIVTSNL